jgi:uncharacterized protein (UPF0147 family)
MAEREYYFEQIEREFGLARKALHAGNDGMGRVCARRAAGQAITWFLTVHHKPGWGTDAMSQLQHLSKDATFPEEVRTAASRLTTKISDKFIYPFTTNPIDDATLVIAHITRVMDEATG